MKFSQYQSTATTTYDRLEETVEDLAPVQPAVETHALPTAQKKRGFSLGRTIGKLAVYSSLALFSLFCAIESNAQNININGTVTSKQRNGPVYLEKVIAIKTSTNNVVGTTYTNTNGQYTLQFIWDQIQDQNLAKKNSLYPNPSQGPANIDFYSPTKSQYTLLITEPSGKQIINDQIPAERGNNKIVLNNGEGIYFITLTDGVQTHQYKFVQNASTGSKLSYEFVHNTNSQLKSSLEDILMVGDEVRLEFTRDPTQFENYLPSDTTFIVQSTQTVDRQLDQIPYTFTTTLKPFIETGAPVTTIDPNFTLTVEFAAPTGTKTYPVTAGQINIQENLFPVGNNLGNVWVSHDTANYNGFQLQNWTLIRQINQVTNRPNVAQNATTAGPLIPDYKTSTSLDSLDNKVLHLYTIKNKAETQPGQFEYLNSEGSKGLIASSGDGLSASTFINLAPYGVADSADFVRFGFNLSNNVPNTLAEQARLDNIFQLAINTRYLPNYDTLLPPHRIYTITSTADPRWQIVVARGFENSIYTTYHNGTPSNGRFWATDYTFNGKPRINYTIAKYATANGDATIFTENFSAVTGEEEGSGGLSDKVWNATTNLPSGDSYSISTLPALLTLGTGQ
jgi:hypothetical protein